jgi:HTH-type transcriptional regulator/antitoxin HigA
MTASTQRQSREVTVPLIRSDADLDRALVEINALMDKDTLAQAEEDRLNTMTVLVEAYEREHFPVGPPDPIEAIKFRLEQLGYETPAEQTKILVPIMGTRARVHEVMHKTRGLSPRMVNGLWKKFEIPLDVLVSGMLTPKKKKKKKSKKAVAKKQGAPRNRSRPASTAKKLSHQPRHAAAG